MNRWENKATWIVNIYFRNKSIINDLKNECENKFDLAEELEDYVKDYATDYAKNGFVVDMLSCGLDQVNWLQLAECFMELDAKEE